MVSSKMDLCETVSLQSEENEAKMLYTTILDEQQLPQFKCLKCGLTYIREYVMKNHIKVHLIKRNGNLKSQGVEIIVSFLFFCSRLVISW